MSSSCPRAGAAVLGGALLVGSRLALARRDVQRVDVRVGDTVRRASVPALDRIVTYTTDLGSMYAVAGMSVALAATGRPRLSADVLAAGSLAWVVAQQSKKGVARQRPYEADGVRRLIRPPTGSSFPSGHAAVGMAVATVVGGRSPMRAATPLLRAVGAYIALSRVYVGVHYPSDVIGGAGLGLAVGSVWPGAPGSGRYRFRCLSAWIGALPLRCLSA
ncbi:MAG TPA: phosphatase PAP2 family protein [Egibacteraceae bacterium]|nr:phosphatase PAP2 family protein [Egibacteraceae bacterium]